MSTVPSKPPLAVLPPLPPHPQSDSILVQEPGGRVFYPEADCVAGGKGAGLGVYGSRGHQVGAYDNIYCLVILADAFVKSH